MLSYSMKISFAKFRTKFRFHYLSHLKNALKHLFWFFTGALISLVFIVSIGFFIYQAKYTGRIYPGIFVNGIDFSAKTQSDVKNFFDNKNKQIGKNTFELVSDYGIATISAKDLNLGYNSDLLATQAMILGRSPSSLSNLSLVFQAYLKGINLKPSYTYSRDGLETAIIPIREKIDISPINAQFIFENGKVTTFKPSSNGQTVDINKLNESLVNKTQAVVTSKNLKSLVINIPIKTLYPDITTEKANSLGIKELIGEGDSLFFYSIPGRIYNVNLAASRLNGVLVAPNEVFSFDKTLGDVSSFTGYKQAYIIQNGHTVLGDGGGVCQVSTTFFRAILNAGLPIVERHAHAYRVGYYEQNSPPGIDATIYVPSVDLKFKNDTGHYILIQTEVDLNNLSLKFLLYGTKDERQVSMTTPVITNQTAPPPPLYQDDPNLPLGQIQQTDFEAWGANVYFTRTVTKNGKVTIYDKFVSNYQPWQAVYLRGTKQ